jgi:hypothetical protein
MLAKVIIALAIAICFIAFPERISRVIERDARGKVFGRCHSRDDYQTVRRTTVPGALRVMGFIALLAIITIYLLLLRYA